MFTITIGRFTKNNYEPDHELSEENIRAHPMNIKQDPRCSYNIHVTFINRDIHEIMSHIHKYIDTNINLLMQVVFDYNHIIILNSMGTMNTIIFETCVYNNIFESYHHNKYIYHHTNKINYICDNITGAIKKLYSYPSRDAVEIHDPDKIKYIMNISNVSIRTLHHNTTVISYLLE